MIPRKQMYAVVTAVAKGTWEHLPTILALIPATAVAGRVLVEIKKIGEQVKAQGQTEEKQLECIKKLINECGGETEFKKKLHEELKVERDSKNPTYINCAIFEVCADASLSETEQQKLMDTLLGELEPKTDEIARFVNAFREDYFGDDYETCDNAIEIGMGYISFNFDDMSDHKYDEEDLQVICDMLNRIVGRKVFDEYEGLGTDDSCVY